MKIVPVLPNGQGSVAPPWHPRRQDRVVDLEAILCALLASRAWLSLAIAARASFPIAPAFLEGYIKP